ncbi:hypothetical protein [Armatimonas sp.]|uniref:hypothetical protein n=1 Tax=Armatimonas sp. TaxID=1872638 RepID=UPI00286C2226|nr:hypothetical protein [Armatimonas sp.]
MTTDNKDAAVDFFRYVSSIFINRFVAVLGGIAGAIGLTALTMAYHEYLWPGIGGDGQYGMVLFPTATWGGFFYGAASAVLYLDRKKNPFRVCKTLTLVGLSPSGLWVLASPGGGGPFCLPALVVGLVLLAYLVGRER